jgi:hypothetical protein
MALSKEDIKKLASSIGEIKPVELASGTVYVRGMNGFGRDVFEREIVYNKQNHGRGLIACLTLCNEKGEFQYLYRENNRWTYNPEDVDMLESLPYQELDLIVMAGRDISELSPEALETLKKNIDIILGKFGSQNKPDTTDVPKENS